MVIRWVAAAIVFSVLLPQSASAQSADEPPAWHVMQDATVYGLFNHQGGPRGGDEFRVPNWWMGMFERNVRSSTLTINTMVSLDALTVGKKGYRELFQVGEAFEGEPLIDYQHPHDLFMQLAAVWRMPIGTQTGFTLAGGPSAEPALGPVAVMHRASALENPMSPLSHHTFDSTHIAFGVITAAVDRGPWTIEGSIFNGREPDEDRWDFDFGALDSYSGRVWFRPRPEWEFQMSSGRLKSPEELGHGNITRTTGSASWLKQDAENFTAVTAAFGVNAGEDASRHAILLEATRRAGRYSTYGRLEFVDVETGLLLDDHAIGHEVKDTVAALTLGGVRELPRWHKFETGIGAALTVYGVPDRLTPSHGNRPVSLQVFVRMRPSAGAMGRMWNMYMTKPMHPAAADPHAGHHMP
ncbi:MAG TPA: hypothetical protein VM115_13630 [Vicinamibacterales bacterium]|nr:hypothetical protein [Vicinamibacterales bacterium]